MAAAKSSKKKKVVGYIKLQVSAGEARPAPPVGPALGQSGLNIMEFCKAFNKATEKMEKGTPIPVIITAFADKTFTFVTKMPPCSFLLKKAAGLSKGSQNPGQESIGQITEAQVQEIASMKMPDLNANDVGAAYKMVCGSARSMGLKVVK